MNSNGVFYERRVQPIAGDISAAGDAMAKFSATVADGVGEAIKAREENKLRVQKEKQRELQTALENREKDEQRLWATNYTYQATKAAAEAYQSHSQDMGTFEDAYRVAMDGIEVPAQYQNYAANIATDQAKSWVGTIARNNLKATQEGLKTTVNDVIDQQMSRAGLIQTGEVASFDSAAEMGSAYAIAVEQLNSTYADGTPMFSTEEIEERYAEFTNSILSTQLGVDTSSGLTFEQAESLVDPDFDFSVSFVTPTGQPMTLKRSDLPEPMQRQFEAEQRGRLGQVITQAKQAAELEIAYALWKNPANFIGSNATQKSSLNLMADAEIAKFGPVNEQNLQAHMDFAMEFVGKFHFLPDSYAQTISTYLNATDASSALVGANLIQEVTTFSPSAVRQFSEDTMLKATMMADQLKAGVQPQDAWANIRTATDATNYKVIEARRSHIEKSSKSEKGSIQLYGNKISNEEYGESGVAEYRSLVDSLYTLNGNVETAQKTAQKYMKANYAASEIGADRRRRTEVLPFMGRSRRKQRNAPEAVYGKGASEIINGELRALAPELERRSGVPAQLDSLMLVATPDTDQAVERGEDPWWIVAHRDEQGNVQWLFDQSSGRALQYSLSEGAREDAFYEEARDRFQHQSFSDLKDKFAALGEHIDRGDLGPVVQALKLNNDYQLGKLSRGVKLLWSVGSLSRRAESERLKQAISPIAKSVRDLAEESATLERQRILRNYGDKIREAPPKATKERRAR